MRILIASDTYYPHVNGASYFTQRLAYYLNARGHAVAVIAPSVSFQNTRDDAEGISVYGIWSLPVLFYSGFRFSPPPILIRRRVQKVIEEFKPEIVHPQSHFFLSRTALQVARRKNIPVAATNHFMPENLVHYLHLPGVITDFIKHQAWRDFSKIFNSAHYVTTPTRTAALLLPSHLAAPVRVISNGIDLKRFNPYNKGSYLRQRYKLPEKPVLLYVGRLDREKNLDVVFRAVAKAVRQVNFHLVIAGQGRERKKLESLAKRLSIQSDVTITGFVPDEDLPNLYTLADCFIIAGIAELQSIATMEAMASGLPVIAVNAVALPELVHDGENGFLFEHQDERTLVDRMVNMFRDGALRARMGEKSLELIAEHDIDKVISSFENLYLRATLGQSA